MSGPIQHVPDMSVRRISVSLEDVEVVILRRYEAAHKAGDEAEMTRLSNALEVFREAVAVTREWALLHDPQEAI